MLSRNAHLGGGLEHDFYDFPYIGNVIIPTDELIFFRGVGIPPTRSKNHENQFFRACSDLPMYSNLQCHTLPVANDIQ